MAKVNNSDQASVISTINMSVATEQDLFRQLVDSQKFRFKSNFIESDPDSTAKPGDIAVRQCRLIWSGYSKFIRSQCNKGKCIDSLHFGLFFKKEQEYICVHDTTAYTVVQNSENIDGKGDLDMQVTSVNLKAIAQVCGCSHDAVQ